jgi:hypothetical protein
MLQPNSASQGGARASAGYIVTITLPKLYIRMI